MLPSEAKAKSPCLACPLLNVKMQFIRHVTPPLPFPTVKRSEETIAESRIQFNFARVTVCGHRKELVDLQNGNYPPQI